ncbi:unnamed protein product [Schistocephalus solidus]|uniref:Peroxisomal multifunctional enzyme type 2 n=1 Tax=Schistocephalus solidus TaxID=70667 RepID=A0A183SPY8_SCHSO|nr:unnamed protein product [Schistocephalus solidus]
MYHNVNGVGGQYAALLHSVGHCECFGYRPVRASTQPCFTPLVTANASDTVPLGSTAPKLTHHVREKLRKAEFLHDFPQSVAIYRVKGIRQIHEGSLMVTVQMIEKDTGEEIPGDVEQRYASVIITELPVPLPFVEMGDGRVFENLRNLSLRHISWKSVV